MNAILDDQPSTRDNVLRQLLCNRDDSAISSLADIEAFLERTRIQCIQPLLYSWFHQSSTWKEWPKQVTEALEQEYRMQAVMETIRLSDLEEILTILNKENIAHLLLKGTALALSLYPESYLRPRIDTDFLIEKKDVERVRQICVELGYELIKMNHGDHVSHQFIASKKDAMGIPHMYDFHWKLSNPREFSELFTFEECMENSHQIQVGETASRILSEKYQLAYSCVHRIAHHHNDEKLTWLYDLHLLREIVRENDWSVFVQLTKEKGIATVCAEGLKLADKWFIAENQMPTYKALVKALEVSNPEETGDFIRHAPRRIDVMISDFKAMPTWRDRLTLVKEHAFPPQDFILEKYGKKSSVWLPFLYLWRMITGVGKLFRNIRHS